MRAMLATIEILLQVQLINETLDFLTESLELISVSCHVANEESLHVPCSSRFPRMSDPTLCRNLL